MSAPPTAYVGLCACLTVRHVERRHRRQAYEYDVGAPDQKPIDTAS